MNSWGVFRKLGGSTEECLGSIWEHLANIWRLLGKHRGSSGEHSKIFGEPLGQHEAMFGPRDGQDGHPQNQGARLVRLVERFMAHLSPDKAEMSQDEANMRPR